MDYEKIHLEGLAIARRLVNEGKISREYAEKMFPELKESEDERIRKFLMREFYNPGAPDSYSRDSDITYNEIYNWLEKQGKHAKFRDSIQVGDQVTRNQDGVLVNLSQLNRVAKKDEKQGEQKPAWSEEDEDVLEDVEEAIINYWHGQSQEDLLDWLKSLKDRIQPQQKQEWSEEDESRMDNLCHFLEEYGNQYYGHLTLKGTISWLKSLKPQNRWKPSDEQMEALAKNVEYVNVGCTQHILKELLEDLKKLREE